MHLRRTLALATGALVLTTLTSCGFDAATDRVNTISAGVDNRDGTVDVLHAVVVSSDDGSGTFVASFSNNSLEDAVSFEGLEGVGESAVSAEAFTAVEVAPGGFVNLANEGGVPVTGDFGPGDFVEVAVIFDNGERQQMEIPVYRNCGDYEGLDDGVAECEVEHESGAH